MDLKNFNRASGLQGSIKRHSEALESLLRVEKRIADVNDPFQYDRFEIMDEHYPAEVAMPIIQGLKAWHQSKIDKYQKEFAEL